MAEIAAVGLDQRLVIVEGRVKIGEIRPVGGLAQALAGNIRALGWCHRASS